MASNRPQPLRIAFLATSLLNCGPNIFTRNLIKGLRGRGHEVTLYYFKPIGDLDFGCPTHRLGYWDARKLSQHDVVLSTMLRPDFWATIFLNQAQRGPRHIVVAHNFIYEDLDFLFSKQIFKRFAGHIAWGWVMKSTNHLATSSAGMAEYYRKINRRPGAISVIPYGIDDPGTLPAHSGSNGHEPDAIKVVACGNLINRKNFQVIIKAISLLPQARLTLIGDGPERGALERLALDCGVQDRVKLAGEDYCLKKHYSEADIYVMSSYSEGFGLAFLEAIGSGLPSVCSRLPIYDGLLPEDVFPRFDPDNHRELAAALLKVASNRQHFSHGCRQTFLKQHTLDAMASAYEQLILDSLAKPRHDSRT